MRDVNIHGRPGVCAPFLEKLATGVQREVILGSFAFYCLACKKRSIYRP